MVNLVALTRIKNQESLVNEIIIQLSQAILEGDFKPGDKLLSEAQLCEKLGVGRNSLREAIKMLNAIGVLETKRGQGTFLAKEISHDVFNPLIFKLILEPKSAKDIYELRILLETIIILMAIKKADDKDIESAKNVLLEVKKLLEQNSTDIDRFVKLDIKFHMVIAKSTHNYLVETILDTIMVIFEPFIKKVLSSENGIQISVINHENLIKIIEEKNSLEAMNVVIKSLHEFMD
jgi:GntR family transcriptional repressor for pyruvate dehydrogenase complex|uniref:FadR/GntR family transcriptional regulator n=1 Tax=Megamonas funiformis TaxID=437897 RepID=UPI0026773C06|nr:FadR/GntR family transcriptional regulator [Megamonas funiformis]